MGAGKEEGRLKEVSLSETLRVLETAVALKRAELHAKCPQIEIKKNITQKRGRMKAFWWKQSKNKKGSDEGPEQ